ncbi:MAG: crossover junction endodeoxyribonuclease RuvC [bacterium]|nr:crossover junction endodeoxyribonuclease RuvC [bacterium]
MIILGLDPGIATTGYGIIEQSGFKLKFIKHGTIITSPSLQLSKRLKIISEKLSELIVNYSPVNIAVEDIFFNMNAKTAMIVGQARGVLLLTAEQHNIDVFSYTPLQVKSAVSGYGHAQKHQVQYMVKKLLDIEKTPKPDDAADALAIAICHSHSHKLKSLL